MGLEGWWAWQPPGEINMGAVSLYSCKYATSLSSCVTRLFHTSFVSLSAAALECRWHAGPAVSAFQKKIRGQETVLRDHICKEMNAMNLERCKCIPKEQPGADWRVLQQIVRDDPSRAMFQVIQH